MKSAWGWRRARGVQQASWTARGVRTFAAVVPWITVALMLLMVRFVAGTLTAAEGVLFDLPDAGLREGAKTDLVALALAMPHETLVFFDDARYVLGDGVSRAALGERFAERARVSGEETLLVLADRKVSAGDLMALATTARQSGLKRVLIANKRTEESAE